MTNEQMDPCRDDGLCSSCADAPRCAACGEYLPEHEDDCDRDGGWVLEGDDTKPVVGGDVFE